MNLVVEWIFPDYDKWIDFAFSEQGDHGKAATNFLKETMSWAAQLLQ
jgi:hypothetical protein